MDVDVFLASRPEVLFLKIVGNPNEAMYGKLKERCYGLLDDLRALEGIFYDGVIEPDRVNGQPWRCRREDLRRVLLVACVDVDGVETHFLATELCFASVSLACDATKNGFPKSHVDRTLLCITV